MWLFIFILTATAIYSIVRGYSAIRNKRFDSGSRRYGRLEGSQAEGLGAVHVFVGAISLIMAVLVLLTNQVDCFLAVWGITLLIIWGGIYSFWSGKESRRL